MPSIRKSPEELKNAGWGTFEAIKSYGTSQIDALRSYVSAQATSVSETPAAQVVVRSVDSALELAEQALDNYLPLGQDEESDGQGSDHKQGEGPPNTQRIVERAGRVSDKMRKRLLRSDLLLLKRALGLLTPIREVTGQQEQQQ